MKPDINSQEYKNAISVELMRISDQYTIEHFVSGRELMYRAAYGVYENVDWNNKKVAIFTGSGNNGGDGHALATILAKNNIDVQLILVSTKFSDDGRYYYDLARSMDIPVSEYTQESVLSEYDIIVDCLLGTGFKGVPREPASSAIRTINASGKYIVSVDINSGMNGDTGEAHIAVRSDLTVSIGYYKKGLFLGKGPELIKDMVNVDIGIKLKPDFI